MSRNKKVLIVSNAFYPENSPRSFRATELAKEFSQQNHLVTVLTHQHPVHEEFAKEFNLTIKNLSIPRFGPVKIEGNGMMLLYRRFIFRFLGLLFEYPDIQLTGLVAKALKKESGYDLLISIAVPYPVHWGVASVFKKNSGIAKIWIADCGDPYMGDRTDSFRKPFYFKYVEKWFSRRANFITIPLEEARDAYYKEFHPKIKIIPQGIKFEDYISGLNTFKPNRILTFCYAGTFIKDNRDPRNFIDYLLTQDIDFKFYIFTNREDLIAHQIQSSNGKIIVRDYIPRKQLIQKMTQIDFLVNFENNTKVQAPSKLLDYYLARRPVLSVKHGGLDIQLIQQFLNRNYIQQMDLDDFNKFRIEKIVSAFLKLAS